MIVYTNRPTRKDFLYKIQHQRTADQIKSHWFYFNSKNERAGIDIGKWENTILDAAECAILQKVTYWKVDMKLNHYFLFNTSICLMLITLKPRVNIKISGCLLLSH